MLKERQQKTLDFMKEYVRENGYPPTVREILKTLGIKSTSTVFSDINHLVEEGYLIKDPQKPRAYKISNFDSEKSSSTENPVIHVPIVGRVAAGQPILAEENIEDTFPIPASFADDGTNYILSVRGESMIDAGILDGDYILVKKQETAKNGDMVVAMVDGFESEATVKTFYKEDGRIRLQPENPTMSPIIVDNVTILGKVTGVFRHF